MIPIKSAQEIKLMREGGIKLAGILAAVIKRVKPGVSTQELNDLAHELIKEIGAEPVFLGYHGYTGVLCASINAEVVHGIPDARAILKNGDIIGLDIGMRYHGLCTDMARTVAVGSVVTPARKLIKVTREALDAGIAAVKPGAHVGDISSAVQKYAESRGYSLVRSLFGHGVGRELHEEPTIPNFGQSGTGPEITTGMTLAIEPMVNTGNYAVETLSDGWTVVTADGQLSAHFEDTIVVTDRGFEILTRP
jgi:methionyl aminopeptidase